MINIKSQKGSITLFVLASLLFFIATVTSVQMYMNSKKVAIEKEYRQIKANYEQTKKINLHFTEPIKDTEDENIIVTESFTINAEEAEYEKIEEIKYGWIYSSSEILNKSSEDISDWVIVETEGLDLTSPISATTNFSEAGYYYLCVLINEKEIWSNTTINID